MRIPHEMFFRWFIPHYAFGNRLMAIFLPAVTGMLVVFPLRYLDLHSEALFMVLLVGVGAFSVFIMAYHKRPKQWELILALLGSQVVFVVLCAFWSYLPSAHAKETITTNEVIFPNPPEWVTESRVQKITDKIQDTLEWRVRRITVTYHADDAEFQRMHRMGPSVQAYSDTAVHLGPKVNKDNFDAILGHELVHVILRQKYKQAIPKWLEEGLATYLSQSNKVDYKWLAQQPPVDVTKLTHPYQGSVDFKTHYFTSQAAMEMIAAKCSLHDLLQLSVGKRLETYLSTYCEIKDLNADYQAWLKKKAS